MHRRSEIAVVLVAAFVLVFAGCGKMEKRAKKHKARPGAGATEAGRPHAGIAAHIGDHYVELVLHPEDGDLECYTIGADGVTAAPIEAAEIKLSLRVGNAGSRDVIVKATEGEKTASRFKGHEPTLKGATEVHAKADLPKWGPVEFEWKAAPKIDGAKGGTPPK